MSSSTPKPVPYIQNGMKKNTFLKKHGPIIAAIIIIAVVVLAVIFKKQITNFFKSSSKKLENDIKEPVIVISGSELKKKETSNKVETYIVEYDNIDAKLTEDFKISVTLKITMFGEFIDNLRIKRIGGNLTEPHYVTVKPDIGGETPYTNKEYTEEFTPLPDEVMLGVFKFEIEYTNPANTDFTKIGDTYTLGEITINEISLTEELGKYPLAVNAEAGPVTAITDFSKKETRFYMEKDNLDFLEDSNPYYLAPVEGRESSFKIIYMNDISTQLTVYEVEGVKIAFFETPALKNSVLWKGLDFGFGAKTPGIKDYTKVTSNFYLRDVNGKKLIALDTGKDIYNSTNPDILIKGEIEPNGNSQLTTIKSLFGSNNIKYLLAKELRKISGNELITRGFINIEKSEGLKIRQLYDDISLVKLHCKSQPRDDVTETFKNGIIKYAARDENFNPESIFCGKDKLGKHLPGQQCRVDGDSYPGWRNTKVLGMPDNFCKGTYRGFQITFNDNTTKEFGWSAPIDLTDKM